MKTVEVPLWPTAHERRTFALERIATALERIADYLGPPRVTSELVQPWLSQEEEAAFLKSVGDDTP